MKSLIVLTLFFIGCLAVDKPTEISWVLPKTYGGSFHGYVHEDTKEVELDPLLQVKVLKGGSICAFKIHNLSENAGPFVAELVDGSKGVGRIVVQKGANINFQERHRFKFQVEALDCATPQHASEKVYVYLEVIPAERPLWGQSVYNAVIADDSRVGSDVVQVNAYEKGRTAGNSICDYKITGPLDAPFDVDGNGVIRTKDHLHASEHRNYVLRVTATDCWRPKARSSTISVNIRVIHPCKTGWKGVFEQVNYRPNSGVRLLSEQAQLEKCPSEARCVEDRVTATVTLEGTETSNTRGCDRDTYSLRAQRRMCGAVDHAVELLPPADTFAKTGRGSVDAVEGVYTFDGQQSYWEVPTSSVPADHQVGEQFTLSFWMRHQTNPDVHQKEQILCNSDGDAKNRHHYSVFVRNCKLILLLRREPKTKSPANTMAPAEWRFHLEETCDGRWHHYALSFEAAGDRVKLYLDGKIFVADTRNPEVVEDWPMHANAEVHFTKMAVGACWHAKLGHFAQFFKGQMAGVTLLRGKTEADRVIRCLTQCQEKLDFHAMSQMNPGMSVSLNSQLSMIIVNGHNASEVAKLVRKIGYLNTRIRPAPGKRTVKIATEMKCREPTITVSIPDVITTVLVLAPDTHSHGGHGNQAPRGLEVSGTDHLPVEEARLRSMGQLIFSDLEIKVKGPPEPLDSCIIRTWPGLVPPTEYLDWPKAEVDAIAAQSSTLYGVNNTHGLVLEGIQSALVYRDLIRKVRFVFNRPELYNRRRFQLTCSQQNGDVTSNQFEVKLDILHPGSPQLTPPVVSEEMGEAPAQVVFTEEKLAEHHHAAQSNLEHRLVPRHPKPESLLEEVPSSKQSAIYAVLSVCGVILLGIALVGLARYRSSRMGTPGPGAAAAKMARSFISGGRRLGDKRSRGSVEVIPLPDMGEMEWDNSEMTGLKITVNPLDQESFKDRAGTQTPTGGARYQQVDSDEEENSSLDGIPDEEDEGIDGHDLDDLDLDDYEEAGPPVRPGQLEWDDSSIPPPFPHQATSPPRHVNV